MTDEHIRQRLRGWKKLKKESADTNNAETKHEQWKIDEYKNHLNVVCSNCNKEFYVYKQGQYRIDRSNYCPNCGAKMNRERIAIDNLLKEMVGEEEMREYLVKVRYALSGLKIYRVKTDNIYRIIGKFYCTSLERINRIDYSRCTRGGERYWENEGFEINQYTEPVLSEDKE